MFVRWRLKFVACPMKLRNPSDRYKENQTAMKTGNQWLSFWMNTALPVYGTLCLAAGLIWCISSGALTAFAQAPTNNPSRTDNTDSLTAAAETEQHPATNQTGSVQTEPPRKPSIFDSIPRTKPPKPATNQTAFAGSDKQAKLSTAPFEELKKKAESGDADAQCELAKRYLFGQGVPQDYTEAVKWYRKAAEQGNARAQDWLGFCYQDGLLGVSQDYTEAVKWFRKAAEQGDAAAQDSLGVRYANGEGVPQNYTEAVKWFRKAAEHGAPGAQCDLGVSYANGQGVPQDYVEAAKWFWKAAEQGFPWAQAELGFCYYNGQGVAQDYQEAVKWFRKAAELVVTAQYGLGTCYYNGKGVAQDSTEAVKWFRKAAEQGDATAQYALGSTYADGLGVPQDYTEAVKWYRKSAEQGYALAQDSLGACYGNGQGVPQDHAEAVKWFRKAAEQGYARAQDILGFRYYNGQGVAQDYQEAVKWFRKAAEQGDAMAQDSLGLCYYNGQGVPQDHAEAVKWFRKAAEQGDAMAQNSLGACYGNGQGVPQDHAEAAKWLRKAAEQGNADAQFNLGLCYDSGRGVPKDYTEAYKWYNLAAAQSTTNAAHDRDQLAYRMTPEQIAEGQRRASQFVARHEKAAAGDQGSLPDAAATPKGNGTGFLITQGGYVVTSYHVVSDATAIKIVMDGSVRAAKLVKADPVNDLALLQVAVKVGDILRSTVPRSLPIMSSRDVKLGDSVFTLGFPNIDLQGVEPKLTRGEINSLAGIQDDPRLF
jgi:TPR repeat protein